MEFKYKKIDKKQMRQAILCIGVGTAAGLVVYGIFLYFHIDIFGWNLGLIFAPLAAGYVETILANRIIGENIGAISAFILFIDTTFYSFILKNPTLGWNLITAGSILVILQAAFPTLINYIFLVVVGGILSAFVNKIKNIEKKVYTFIKNKQPFKWEDKDYEIRTKVVPFFDELKSNETINDLNFFFLTSSDMVDKKHEIMKMYHSEVIIDNNTHVIKSDPEKAENEVLVNIKNGKDECLINLANQIKAEGGNGILDLAIYYSVIGPNRSNIQITAMGMGLLIN